MRKVQKYFLNGLIIALASVLMRSLGVMFNAYITSKIGAEGMGLITLMGSVYGFAITLATSGINLAVVRLISSAYGDTPDKNSYTSTGKIMKNAMSYALIFSLTASCLLLVSAKNIGLLLLKDERTVIPLKILAFTLPLIAISSIINGYFCGVRRVYKNVVSQFAEQGIKIASVSALLLVFSKDTEGGCIAVILGGAVAELGSLIISATLYFFDRKIHHYSKNMAQKTGYVTENPLQKHSFYDVFTLAFPVAVSAYVRSALGTIEHLIIPMGLSKHGADAKGALASYGTLHGMVIPVIYFPCAILSAFASLLVPELSSAQASGNKRQIEYIASRVISVTLLFSLIISATLISLSYELGIFIYNSHEAGHYIKLLAPLVPIMYLDIVTDTMLKGLNEQLYSMRVNIADSLISIILLLTLLPTFGIRGYVTAVFITELFNTSMSVIRLSDVTGITAPILKWVIKPLFSSIFSVFLTNLIPTLFPFGNLSSLIFKILFITLFYITLSRLIGAVSREDVSWAKSLVNVK